MCNSNIHNSNSLETECYYVIGVLDDYIEVDVV